MNRFEYLQVHQNTLLIPHFRLEEVQDGIAASRCMATITPIEIDSRVYAYSDAPPEGKARKETMYLVSFAEPDHGATFQQWYDAQQANQNVAAL